MGGSKQARKGGRASAARDALMVNAFDEALADTCVSETTFSIY
jgi:hypothetical protein